MYEKRREFYSLLFLLSVRTNDNTNVPFTVLTVTDAFGRFKYTLCSDLKCIGGPSGIRTPDRPVMSRML